MVQLLSLGVVHTHEDLYTQTSRCGAYDSRSGGWATTLFRRCAAAVFGAVTDILFGSGFVTASEYRMHWPLLALIAAEIIGLVLFVIPRHDKTNA